MPNNQPINFSGPYVQLSTPDRLIGYYNDDADAKQAYTHYTDRGQTVTGIKFPRRTRWVPGKEDQE